MISAELFVREKGLGMVDRCIEFIKALGLSCQYLAKAEISNHSLNEVLEMFGQLMDVRTVSLLRKRYLDRNEYLFEFVSQWSSSAGEAVSLPDSLNPQNLPSDWIVTLNEQRPVVANGFELSLLRAASNLLLVPVFCEEQFSFVLAFSDFQNCEVDDTLLELGMATGNIFGLWAKKIQTEHQLAEIMDFIPSPVLVLDSSGTVKAMNKAIEEVPEWSTEKTRKFKQTEINQKSTNSTASTFSKDFADKGIFVPSKTGTLYDICDRPYGSIHYMEDVTREREIAKNLRRSETMYRTIIDFAGVGIILFRKDRILYYNERLAEFLGIAERIITLTDFMNWIDYSEPKVRKFFQKSSREINNPTTFEFSTKDRGEGLRHYQGYGRVIGYENRSAVHFILDDITEQKELAKIARMNELKLQHEDRLTALGVMAAGIAHELNQPLNTIRVISDTSLFGRDQGWELNEEEIFDGLEMISKQVLRMSDVIHSIRNFAREDRGKFENIDPNDAIKNVFSMIGKQFEAHGIHIEMDLGTHLLPIRGNINAFEQVIMNLVVNSRQALEEHQQFNKKLWIKSGTRFNQFFIEVGDNACGIPDELRINVFDPFYTTKEPGKGTGLGLSISQSIVTEFKGTIKVYNNDQGGATFFITAPFSGVKS